MGKISINNTQKIITARFIGDYSNDDYKTFWFEGLHKAKTNNLKRVFVDQSEVGKVSMSARSWFVMIMIPLIKKELGSKIALSILPAKEAEKSAVAKYFIKMTQAITSFSITVGKNEEDCIQLLISEKI